MSPFLYYLDNSITYYPENMDIWAKQVIPSFVRTYLANTISYTSSTDRLRFGLFLENVASLLSSDVKLGIMKDCIEYNNIRYMI